MSAAAQPELTYGEIIEWASVLGHFTATDLAHHLGVDHETGKRAVGALCRQGICTNTGDPLDGPNGYEYIIEYVPPPAGPSERPRHATPEQVVVSHAQRITVKRGEPVRIRTTRKMGRALSTPGQRQFHKNREANYQRQETARAARATAQQSAAQRDPKWKRNK